MTLFTLTFDILALYATDQPRISLYYGGVKLSTFYATNELTPRSFEIESDNFNHALLRVAFANRGTEPARTVTITNLTIDSDPLQITEFSEDNGADVLPSSVVLEQGEFSDIDLAESLGLTPAAIYGTDGADKMYANDYGNEIFGKDGNDTLYGGDSADILHGDGGNDSITGRLGDDIIYGGDGDDNLWGREDNDTLYGDAGNDRLRGDGGDDTLYGGIGNDSVYGGDGNDTLYGGEGDDYLYGHDGANFIYGDDGNDRLFGGADIDNIDGGADQDRIHGWGGDDILRGGDGNDIIAGDEGNDTLYGDDGSDQLIGDEGDDTLYGGNGTDRLVGHTGNDTLYGEADNDILEGRDGDDILDGGAGSDRLYGGDGADIISGGDGNDFLYAYNTIIPTAETFEGRILGDTPVLYLQLNELNGTTSTNLGSGTGLNSIYTGGVTLGQDALFSGGDVSADFDGVNDYISVPNSSLINLSDVTQRTIELIFNADTTMGRQVLFEEGGGTNAMVIYIDEGQLYFNVRDGSGTTWGPFDISTSIDAGTTYHTALVMDTSTGFVGGYLNGTLVGTGTALTTLSSHSGQIGIGGMNNATHFHDGAASGNGYYFDGRISDVAIHNNALDVTTLEARYNTMLTGGSNTSFNDGDDVLDGGAGDDELHLSAGNDNGNGGSGNDVIYGGIGINILNGDDGNDVIYADGQQINGLSGSIGSLNSLIAAASPVAYWKFDDIGGTVADNIGSIGNAADGTYENGVALQSGGLYASDDSSANFDGINDRVQVADNSQINTSAVAQRTIEIVFNADTTSGRQVLFEEGGTVNAIAVYVEDGDLYFNARDGNGAIWGPFNINTPIDSGTTYHAAFVLDSSVGTIAGYLDGNLVGTGIIDGVLNGHGGDIGIGFSDGGAYYHDGADGTTGYYFDGKISDVAIYNTALSQSELQDHVQIMNGSFTFTDPFSDTLNGGEGFDQLYGGNGRDLFIIDSVDAALNIDEIFDFSTIEGDTLDISGLISGWTGNISEFVNITDDGTNTSIQIDVDGLNNGSNFSTVAQLNNITGLDESALHNSGQLVVI